MPRERLAEALALAEAADDEHRAQVRCARANAEDCIAQAEIDAEHRGWLRGYEHNGVERRQMCDERNDARADAERVRRGARCLRERCRRLEARAKMAEEAHKSHVDAAIARGKRLRDALAKGGQHGKRE